METTRLIEDKGKDGVVDQDAEAQRGSVGFSFASHAANPDNKVLWELNCTLLAYTIELAGEFGRVDQLGWASTKHMDSHYCHSYSYY